MTPSQVPRPVAATAAPPGSGAALSTRSNLLPPAREYPSARAPFTSRPVGLDMSGTTPSLCHTQVHCLEVGCCPGPVPEEELQAVQPEPKPAPSAEQSASYLDNLTCAICLDQIAPCNIASIPQCDHQYCGASLLPRISPVTIPQAARCLAQLSVSAPCRSQAP